MLDLFIFVNIEGMVMEVGVVTSYSMCADIARYQLTRASTGWGEVTGHSSVGWHSI